MRSVIATLLMILLGSPVLSGELDGKGLWCDWQGFFFKDGAFELYSRDSYDSDNDGNKFEQNRVFSASETSYSSSDQYVRMYFKKNDKSMYKLLDRISLESRRVGCEPECKEVTQCEVIDNLSDFNKRLKIEEEKYRKEHEQKLKKRKI